MQLLKSYEQSISILIYMDKLNNKDYVKAESIGKKLGYSVSSTKKVISELASDGIVESISGPKGGIKLKKKLQEISLYDILVATESKTIFSVDYDFSENSFDSKEEKVLAEQRLKSVLHTAAFSFLDNLKTKSVMDLK